MTLGLSVFLVVAGATLRYALTWRVAGVDLPVLGLILMVAGIVTSVICVLRAVVPLPARAAARERRTIPLADGRRGLAGRSAPADSLTVPDALGAAASPAQDAEAPELPEPYPDPTQRPDLAQRPYFALEQRVFRGRVEAEPAEPRDEAGI
ncbi:DUF6458 family protein [Frankia tisae]|uniref:DUF6458 family protein n=1 Tax=Frankia tisae TaxID=2950104 RepID=UPI0021C0C5FE|nr:DUF6458 family protein [Frankia tisae]